MANIELDLIPNSIDSTVAWQSDFLRSIVNKPIEHLRYSTYYDDKSIGISYFESEELNSDDNLQVVDDSWSINENDRRRFDDSNYRTFNSRSISSKYKDVIITNIVGTDLHNREIPLFYKHKIPLTEKIYNIDSITVVTNERSDTISYGYAVKKGMLYTNYKNVFDPKTLEYRVYFVNGTYVSGEAFNSILNVEPAISELNWENYLNDDISKYTKEEQNDGFLYTVEVSETLAAAICANGGTMNYYLKRLKSNSLYIKKPSIKYIDNEWFVEISNGYLTQTIGSKLYKYTVPEYNNQNFNIEKPLIRLDDKDCFRVTDKIVKLPYSKIKYDESKEMYLNLHYINDAGSKTQLAIKSVDEAYGFVELETALPRNVDVKILASFYYETKTLYFNGINFNPYQNKDILNEKIIFYVLPNQTERSVHYLTVKKDGRFFDSNSSNPNVPQLGEFRVYKSSLSVNKKALFLGEVYFKDTSKLKNCFEFDIRKSNVLIESKLNEIFKRNPQLLQSKLGYGSEGQRVPKDNIVFLDLPISLIESGDYTEDQLLNLFKRFLKASTNLIINYTYRESSIKFESYIEGDTKLKLSFEGPGKYELLKSENGIFTVIKEWNVEDQDDYDEHVDGNFLEPYTDETTAENVVSEYKTKLNGRLSKRLYRMVPYASN